MNKFIKNKKGVTLIVLVITIIVLLVIAGVALYLSNGVMTRVREAKKDHDKSAYQELISLEIGGMDEYYTNEYTEEYLDNLQARLEERKEFKGANYEKINGNALVITTKEGYKYTVIGDIVLMGSVSTEGTSIIISPNSAQIKNVGTNFEVTPRIISSDISIKTIQWKSTDPTVATVSANETNGEKIIVSCLKEGSTTISATLAEGNVQTASFVLTVKEKVNVTEFSYESDKINIGQKTGAPTIAITGTPKSEPTFSSSDPSVATVDSSTGIVTGVAEGTATITISYTNYDETKSEKTYDVKIIVKWSDISANNYGDYVNYKIDLRIASEGTKLGKVDEEDETALADWRIFYEDDTYTYIIAADYIPTSEFPSGIFSNNNGKYNGYWSSAPSGTVPTNTYKDSFLFNGLSSISTSNPNYKTVTYLLNTSLWSKFVNGAYADACIGGPTLEMLCASWTEKYPSEPLYFGVNSKGYTVGKTQSGVNSSNLSISSYAGYKNTLYFSHSGSSWNSCCGYWLASPSPNVSASRYEYLWDMYCYHGNICQDRYNRYWNGVRPVVRLKSTVAAEKDEDGVWQLK